MRIASAQPRLNEAPPADPLPGRSETPPLLPSPNFGLIENETPHLQLSHYLWVLRRYAWKIVAFIAACLLVTYLVSSRMQPIYQSTATVNVDRHAPSDVVGQDSTRAGTPNDADQFLATQVKMVQSDEVLRPVVEKFHLFSQGRGNHGSAPGQEQLQSDEPVTLPGLRVMRPPNTYLLQITYQSPDPRLAADVANSIAKSYLLYTYNLRSDSAAGLSSFMEKQLDELKSKMESSGLALAQFEKDLDVINPEEKTNILTARLLQLNTEYTTAEADRVRAEASWQAIQSGSLGAAEASPQGEGLAKLTDSLNQARERLAFVTATYGENHPEYIKASSEVAEIQKEFAEARNNLSDRIRAQYKESLSREQMLQAAVATTKAEWDRINSRSFEYQRLKQEAETDKNLYDELIKKIREADINAGFRNNNIRIASIARPSRVPVAPNTPLNLVIAFLMSALIAIIATIITDSFDTTLRDPREAGRFLGCEVIAVVPADQLAAHLPRPAVYPSKTELVSSNFGSEQRNGYRSASSFDESVRSLRNTIFLSDFEGRLHSIAVTSARPAEGKTTLAAHLAIANADRGMKTLLVDGDLRRPTLHSKFGLSPHHGLGSVLTGELSWQDVVLPIEGEPNLSLIPAGRGSHRAADLIGPRLSTLLDEFTNAYDLVVLDTPPLLAFAEPLQMAVAADGVLIVAKAAETERRPVAEVTATLRRLRANIIGVVLNQMDKNTSKDGYYKYYENDGKYYSKERRSTADA